MSNESDFDGFFAATAPRLVRHIYLNTGDLARAQECVQEAYLRAWRHWASVGNGDRDPVAWVRSVAWRLAINDWRRARRVANALVRRGAEQDQPPPSTDVVAVRQALRCLPKDQRTAIVLYYFEDLSVREAADLLQIPEGTVKARLSRGRTALGRHFEESDKEVDTWART